AAGVGELTGGNDVGAAGRSRGAAPSLAGLPAAAAAYTESGPSRPPAVESADRRLPPPAQWRLTLTRGFPMFRSFFLSRRWVHWSVLGSVFIVGVTWFRVQMDVKINEWFGGFYDTSQKALGKPGAVTFPEILGYL